MIRLTATIPLSSALLLLVCAEEQERKPAEEITNPLGTKLRYLPPGEFAMGSRHTSYRRCGTYGCCRIGHHWCRSGRWIPHPSDLAARIVKNTVVHYDTALLEGLDADPQPLNQLYVRDGRILVGNRHQVTV